MKIIVNKGAYEINISGTPFPPTVEVSVSDEFAATLCQKYNQEGGNFYFVEVGAESPPASEVFDTPAAMGFPVKSLGKKKAKTIRRGRK